MGRKRASKPTSSSTAQPIPLHTRTPASRVENIFQPSDSRGARGSRFSEPLVGSLPILLRNIVCGVVLEHGRPPAVVQSMTLISADFDRVPHHVLPDARSGSTGRIFALEIPHNFPHGQTSTQARAEKTTAVLFRYVMKVLRSRVISRMHSTTILTTKPSRFAARNMFLSRREIMMTAPWPRPKQPSTTTAPSRAPSAPG